MDIKTFVLNIVTLQQQSIVVWKNDLKNVVQEGFLSIAEENHAFNYKLWHAEDRARRDDLGYEFVYRAKREIDYYNQQRNDRVEVMDQWIFTQFQPSTNKHCPVNSETPGMMIDRLSILALKIYHMALQVDRTDVDEAHRKKCLDKTNTLNEQQRQLAICLEQLLSETREKTRTFRLYHQFKMYNDESLNPELYQNKVS